VVTHAQAPGVDPLSPNAADIINLFLYILNLTGLLGGGDMG